MIVQIGRVLHQPLQFGRGRDRAAAERGGGDGARVHQGDIGDLPLRGLGAFAVGEVARGMADGESTVGRDVARAEAGTAEGAADARAAGHQLFQRARAHQLHQDGLTCGIAGQPEVSVAQRRALEDLGGLQKILVCAAGAAGDHALIGVKFPAADLFTQGGGSLFQAQRADGFLVHRVQQIVQIFVEFADGQGVGGVEGQSDHRLNRREVNFYAHVVAGALLRCKRTVGLRPAVDGERTAHGFVRLPDGRQTARFRGHHVDAIAVVDAEICHAVAEEFQHAVLDQSLGEGRGDERQRDVLRADARAGPAGQVYADDARIGDVISAAEQLLDQLRPALADGQRAISAVAGVRIGTEDHPAGAGVHLAHIAVEDRLMRRDKFTAVALRRGQTEHMVVLVDRAADGAQGIVAVGQHIGQRKFLQAGSAGGLDDTHIGDVVGGHGVEFQLQPVHGAGGVVGVQNVIGDRFFAAGSDLRFAGGEQTAAAVVHRFVINLDHGNSSEFSLP